jgi:response regulator RpfG family c-di-GMP phosphodiesterase
MTRRVIWIVGTDDALHDLLEPHLRSANVEVRSADPTSFLTGIAEGAQAEIAVVEDPPRGLTRESFESRLQALSPDTRCIFISRDASAAPDALRPASLAADDVDLNVPEVVDLLARLMGELGEGGEVRSSDVSAVQLKQSLLRCLSTFSELIERYEFVNGGNGPRVARYAVEVAKELGLDAREVDGLSVACLLYDIGMLRIRPEVKLKTTSLAPEERAAIQEHPRYSAEFVEALALPWSVRRDILHHHESYDGSGYPDGLMGRQIPIGSRIIAVADAYFAMTSRRPNRETRSEEEALTELTRQAGQQFDPEVVEIFASLVQVHFLDQEDEGRERMRRIVLVDDDRDLRALIEMKFASLGYQVATVVDPERTVELIVDARPEAVLVNADITWIDAHQLLHRLRQESALAAAAVLLLSRRDSSAAVRARALESAADDYLVRPLGLKEIVQRVTAAIRRKKRLGGADFVRAPLQGGIRGKLSDMGLAEICQVLSQGFKTARVTVVDDKAQGEIYFQDGQVCHATYLNQIGREAFFKILNANEGEFAIEHGIGTPELTIDDRLEFLLMEGMRQLDEARRSEDATGESASAPGDDA